MHASRQEDTETTVVSVSRKWGSLLSWKLVRAAGRARWILLRSSGALRVKVGARAELELRRRLVLLLLEHAGAPGPPQHGPHASTTSQRDV